MNVAFVGLGIMGSRMAARIASANHTVAVWSRSGRGADAAVAAGARVATSVEDAVRDAAVIVTMLWDDAVAREIVRDRVIPAAPADATLVEMTTLSPAMVRELTAAAQARGLAFVAAPVTGSADAAASGTLTALVGGPASARTRVAPVLDAMAARRIEVSDDPAAASALKLANNGYIGVLMTALGDALELAAGYGVGLETTLDVLVSTSERVTKMKAPKILTHDTSPQFALDGLAKDVRLTSDAAHAAGTPRPLFDAAAERIERLAAAGHGDEDMSAIAMR